MAACGQPGERPITDHLYRILRPYQPSAQQPIAMVEDEVCPAHLPAPERRPFGGQAVQRRLEAGQSTRAPVPDLAVGPVLQHRAGFSRGEVHHVPPGGGGQDPAHLLAPTSSPETKCRWKAKNTIVVGIAAIKAPAATTFQDVV